MKLYNTLTKKTEELAIKDKLRIYVCGITPYDYCHIGHARAYLVYDLFLRLLKQRNIPFLYVQNFTDVDDKIIARAHQEKVSFQEIAERFISAYFEDMDKLGVIRAHVYPRVTEHINDIIAMVQKLLDGGYAYQVKSGVYFEVRKFSRYGRLSGKNIDELKAGARIKGEEDKRSPLDFALWKNASPTEPGWNSPFGYGRPGWHIECSALSMHYLGPSFDIHGGAVELAFPHHENEIAQSESATGQAPFVRLWMHCGLVTVEGKKMSKSLGNVVTIQEALQRASANELRWLLLSAHYRSPIDFSWSSFRSVRETLRRLRDTLWGKTCTVSPNGKDLKELIEQTKEKFTCELENDLNTPAALSALFELLKTIRATPITQETFSTLCTFLDSVFDLFGLSFHPSIPEETAKRLVTLGKKYGAEGRNGESVLQKLISLRLKWRKQEHYEKADILRKELSKIGILLEDKREGTQWRLK